MAEEIINSRERRMKFGYLISSMAAVYLDVLFLYIYYIDEEKKCFAMDKKIKNAAVVLRSVTDFILLLHIILQISSPQEKLPKMNLLIDFLALLPIPQIMILVLFANMKSSMYLENRWRMMLLPLYQYVPRVIRIYLLCKQLSRNSTPDDITGTAWVRGTFSFFLFILASHKTLVHMVCAPIRASKCDRFRKRSHLSPSDRTDHVEVRSLSEAIALMVGAFWYCFSVERELHCWQRACKYNSGCKATTFFCEDITGYEKFVDGFCPINPPDPVIFDFGLFLDAHQSGVSSVTDFPVKLLYCFFWGLRALSSFGSNLTPSSYSCENMFAASVSIAGILLVVYLIGNLQVYLQYSTSRSEERRRMMQNKKVEIESWIKYYKVQDKQKEIMEFVWDKFDGDHDVNLKTLLDVFPSPFLEQIKKSICLQILEQVDYQVLQNVVESQLEKVIEHMKPVVFAEQSCIVQKGEPVDQLLFFVKGNGWAFDGDGETVLLEKGSLFGTQFLEWAMGTRLTNEIPLSRKTLRSQTKMEAFALMATDFEIIPSTSHSLLL